MDRSCWEVWEKLPILEQIELIRIGGGNGLLSIRMVGKCREFVEPNANTGID